MSQRYDDHRQHEAPRQSPLGPDYLQGGYFRDKDCKELKPDVVDKLALQVARALADTGITSTQLRRFFNRARALERNLDAKSFTSLQSKIAELKALAANQVGRGLVREDFKRFIDRNVDLATQRECDFKDGFIAHFQAVLGFFVFVQFERQQNQGRR